MKTMKIFCLWVQFSTKKVWVIPINSSNCIVKSQGVTNKLSPNLQQFFLFGRFQQETPTNSDRDRLEDWLLFHPSSLGKRVGKNLKNPLESRNGLFYL